MYQKELKTASALSKVACWMIGDIITLYRQNKEVRVHRAILLEGSGWLDIHLHSLLLVYSLAKAKPRLGTQTTMATRAQHTPIGRSRGHPRRNDVKASPFPGAMENMHMNITAQIGGTNAIQHHKNTIAHVKSNTHACVACCAGIAVDSMLQWTY